LVSLDISALPVVYGSARKVPAQNDELGHKMILDAIVEHLLKGGQSFGVVQPDI
jgi:hypothetical protein